MAKLRLVCAVLLAVPLIVFGGNYFVQAFELPEGDGSSGDLLLQSMRDGGLMTWIALSHVVVGVMLLLPPLRYAGALLQLPISLGMVAFHATMLPAGIGPAAVMLVLNVVVLADPKRLANLTSRTPPR